MELCLRRTSRLQHHYWQDECRAFKGLSEMYTRELWWTYDLSRIDMDLQTWCFNPLMLCHANKSYISIHMLVFVCFFLFLTRKGLFELSGTTPAFDIKAVVTRISIQAFHYLLICIISLQMSQLNSMELATLLYKQIHGKLSLSQSILFSLWLSWDFWCSDVLPHFRLRAAAVYLCSYLKAATLPFLWAKARRHHISSFFYMLWLP